MVLVGQQPLLQSQLMEMCSGTDLYFYTALTYLYFSSTNGESWSPAFTPGSNTGNCAFDRSFQYGYCYESYEYMYLSSTYGSTWTQSSAPYGLDYYGLDGASDSGQYVTLAAFNTGVYVSQNYGSTWTLVTLQQSSISSTAVSGNGQYMFATAGIQVITGYPGRIYYSKDYGTSWKLLPNSFSANYQSVYTSNTGQFVAATFYVKTQYYLSTDYGNSWTTVTAAYNKVVFSTSRWYILSNNVLYYTMNNGTTWASSNLVNCSSPTKFPTKRPSVQIPNYRPSGCPSIPTAVPSSAPTYTQSTTPTRSSSSIAPSLLPTVNPTPAPTFCPLGYYLLSADSISCTACPLNTYGDSNVCVNCPTGFVTGNVASTGKDSCINPATNFVLGVVSLVVGMIFTWIYVVNGRLQLLAVERQVWIEETSVMAYGSLNKVRAYILFFVCVCVPIMMILQYIIIMYYSTTSVVTIILFSVS